MGRNNILLSSSTLLFSGNNFILHSFGTRQRVTYFRLESFIAGNYLSFEIYFTLTIRIKIWKLCTQRLKIQIWRTKENTFRGTEHIYIALSATTNSLVVCLCTFYIYISYFHFPDTLFNVHIPLVPLWVNVPKRTKLACPFSPCNSSGVGPATDVATNCWVFPQVDLADFRPYVLIDFLSKVTRYAFYVCILTCLKNNKLANVFIVAFLS